MEASAKTHFSKAEAAYEGLANNREVTMVLFKEQGLIDTDTDGRIAIKDGERLARYCN